MGKKCNKCDHSNIGEALFCAECGEKLRANTAKEDIFWYSIFWYLFAGVVLLGLIIAFKEQVTHKKILEAKVEKKLIKSIQVSSKISSVFKDAVRIASDGKEMLLLFGQDSDPYTQKIKDDVVSDAVLARKIIEAVTPIYIDARGQKRHKFQHNEEMMDVDTKTLISIYNVTATPTLIFTDSEANYIFVVPGYIPPKQFKATLDFVKEGGWKYKNRKNGDVYKALKAYYKSHDIVIKATQK